MNTVLVDLDVDAGDINEADCAVNGGPVPPTPATGSEVAPALLTGEPTDRHQRRFRVGRDRPRRRRRRRWPAAIAVGDTEPSKDKVRRERMSRLRLVSWSAIGVACLLLAHWLQPDVGTLFEGPSTPMGWASMLCGVAGFWLVPGLWLSSVMMRVGAGLTAWLATRIGTTLAWYALVAPIIHHSGQGARITTVGILVATTAFITAASVGVLLGLSRWPVRPWQRILLPAVIGGVCTQAVISVSMRVWTYDMNYSHIRRLDWLIVLGCALVVTIGALSRPKLPPKRTISNTRNVFVSLAVVAATVAALAVTNTNWSPAQRMPSVFGIEQVPAPAGADVAFALTAIGPEGPQLIQRAQFSASDEAGRVVPVRTQLVGADGTADHAVLLVNLQQDGQPELCRSDRLAKLTMRDQLSGVRVQAMVPVLDGWWCTR
jgi:hypothetical protein